MAANLRNTQTSVERQNTPDAEQVRVTQAALERLNTPDAEALRLTQLTVEAFHQSPNVRVSQVEAAKQFHPSPQSRLTGIAVEVMTPTSPAWNVDITLNCSWLPPIVNAGWDVDAVLTASWYLKVLAGWYAELTLGCEWELGTGTGISDWEPEFVLSCEWDLTVGGRDWTTDIECGVEWLSPSGAKDQECTTGSNEIPAPGERNYVF